MTARLKEQTIEQAREIAHLQERLAASEQRDGSLFDLKRDSVDDICDVIMQSSDIGRRHRLVRVARREQEGVLSRVSYFDDRNPQEECTQSVHNSCA